MTWISGRCCVIWAVASMPDMPGDEDFRLLRSKAPWLKVLVATGYRGYVGQEFIPLRDKVTSLSEAVRICDV